jgi:hypothetical protein
LPVFVPVSALPEDPCPGSFEDIFPAIVATESAREKPTSEVDPCVNAFTCKAVYSCVKQQNAFKITTCVTLDDFSVASGDSIHHARTFQCRRFILV